VLKMVLYTVINVQGFPINCICEKSGGVEH